jgi:hypothetical protein
VDIFIVVDNNLQCACESQTALLPCGALWGIRNWSNLVEEAREVIEKSEIPLKFGRSLVGSVKR